MNTIDELLQDVNEQQRAAITHIEGPLLVLAGAGSGKTRVITRRVGYLLAQGVSADRILALTFTNKAAGEMKQRIEALAPGGRARVWISTFHSTCARILRREASLLGIDAGFSIYDADDTEKLLKEVLAQMRLDPKRHPLRRLRTAISNLKNSLHGPDDVVGGSFDKRKLAEIYRLYQEGLARQQALDFDDLLVRTVKLIREHPDAAPRYAERFDFILVDEYQDTNAAQYAIVQTLGARTRNVCATGDPDQAIYAWRGADVRNILEFTEDYPEATVVRLEQNYRSTQPILDAASALIRHNVDRLDRALWSHRGQGPRPQIVTLRDEKEEAEEIVRRVQIMQAEPGRRLSHFAVFYRTNAQTRAIEQACLAYGLPYVVVGGVAYYARREVKDLLAYLRLLVNPQDDVALRRIINVPRRNIGAATLQRVTDAAAESGQSLLEALPAVCDKSSSVRLAARARQALGEFLQLMCELRELPTQPVASLVRGVIKRTGYLEMLDPNTEQERKENVNELINAAASFDRLNPGSDLVRFLAEAALTADIDRYQAPDDRLTLMTLHMAKGLEFPVVFIAGLEERLLPHARVLQEGHENQIEEERRLAYVGMTRAQDHLILTHARHRFVFGQSQLAARSRFLEEIPAELVDTEDLSGCETYPTNAARSGAEWALRAGGRHRRREKSEVNKGADAAAEAAEAEYYQETDWDARAAAAEDGETNFQPGDRVRHARYGEGRIERILGSAEHAKLAVRFPAYGVRKFSLARAPLERL